MVRIVEGVDVYRHALAMLGDGVGMGDEAEIETAGVVGSHGSLVIGIPIVDKAHALYRVFR